MTTIKVLLEVVFSVGSVPRLFSEDLRPAEGSSFERSDIKYLVGE
jgi:hypothetical protein